MESMEFNTLKNIYNNFVDIYINDNKNSTLVFINQCSSINKNNDDSTCDLTNPSCEKIEK